MEIISDICDFQKPCPNSQCDLYFKIIAKEIIFIIKVMDKPTLKKQLNDGKNFSQILFDYYIIKKKMIILPQRIKKLKIYKFILSEQELTPIIK